MWVWRELPDAKAAVPEILWQEQPARQSLYERFGIAPNASAHEISRRYRELALALHPDTRPNHTQPDHAQSDAAHQDAEEMAWVNAAFGILRDERKRASYDREYGFR